MQRASRRAVRAGRAGAGMRRLTAMLLLSITATLLLGVAATRLPDFSFDSQASAQGPVSLSSQLASEGSVAWGLARMVAAAYLIFLAWRTLKNTEVWRNLLVLLGAYPAAQPDDGAAAHGRLQIDGDPTAGMELALVSAPTPAGTAGASAAPETQQRAIPNLNVSELSGAPGIFTREYTWTSTSSSMSTRESQYYQPASKRSA